MPVQVKQPVMRREFGLWWTPKEMSALREMGVLGLDMEGWHVREALSGLQRAKDHAFFKGVTVGWVAGLGLVLVLRWLGS